MKFIQTIFSVAALFASMTSMNVCAQVVNIDSSHGFTYDGGGSDPAPIVGQHINLIGSPLVQLTLGPGTYEIKNAAGMSGANFEAWSYNLGTSSWAWAFVMAEDVTRNVVLYAEAGYGSSAAEVAALPAVKHFATTFVLPSTTTLDFTLRDYFVPDNGGGISLWISPVPEPNAAALFSVGVVMTILGVRRKRHLMCVMRDKSDTPLPQRSPRHGL